MDEHADGSVPLIPGGDEWLEGSEAGSTRSGGRRSRCASPQGTDPLTGLYPARTFTAWLRLELARAAENFQELAVVVFVVPPAAATELRMQPMGLALRQGTRWGDIPARLSGDTFAVLLRHTGAGAEAMAARMTPVLSQTGDCQVNSGMAWYPEDALQAAELLEIALQRSGPFARTGVAAGADPVGCAGASPPGRSSAR